ncbi:hypothetical protein B296_00035841 [Ensete ventricosum]|uniref:Uncharacterized protein n=1 Tax=Ensete ventricosum TaxID=4639 RepID=A0A426ZY74_ENSVE|nr:hypothetical protein B296_00035841 [Ensete ventricosum]
MSRADFSSSSSITQLLARTSLSWRWTSPRRNRDLLSTFSSASCCREASLSPLLLFHLDFKVGYSRSVVPIAFRLALTFSSSISLWKV